MAGGMEQARFKGMLESLQQTDPDIDHIVTYSKFVVVYLLQQDGANPGWQKANIDGPVYLVRRRTLPRYQFLVKNRFSTNDLLDNLHPEWALDCQKNYVFYKVEDPAKRIRGLWFHDDQERQRIEESLNKTLEEIRIKPPVDPVMPPMQTAPMPAPAMQTPAPAPAHTLAPAHSMSMPNTMPMPSAADIVAPGMDNLYAQFGMQKPEAPPGQERVTLTLSSLRAAWHAMADDDDFMRMILQKLKDAQ